MNYYKIMCTCRSKCRHLLHELNCVSRSLLNPTSFVSYTLNCTLKNDVGLRRLRETQPWTAKARCCFFIFLCSSVPPSGRRSVWQLVFRRTLYLQGVGRTDFSLWYTDIQTAAGGKGNALKDQQLSRSDIPIIVDSCIAFITQYGESDQ